MKSFLNIVIILVAFLMPSLSLAQENNPSIENLRIIDQFITSAKNPTVATDVILSQQVIIKKELTDEYFEYLEVSLDEVRLNIQMKDITQIQKINFKDLSRKETKDIDLEGKNPQNVYFLKIKDRLLVALYLENSKIASFTLVSKGDHVAHFVTY